jgi:hypothetical protein
MTFSTKDLFEAAREDAPTEGMHDAVWKSLAAATAAPMVASIPRWSVAKPFVIGTVVGGGIVAAILTSPVSPIPPAGHAVRAPAAAAATRAAEIAPAPARVHAPPERAAASASAAPRATESSLDLEAQLVTRARAALVAGDAERALDLLRTAEGFKQRSLEPEVLALKARAFRALGRTEEAFSAELALRTRYPGHALLR